MHQSKPFLSKLKRDPPEESFNMNEQMPVTKIKHHPVLMFFLVTNVR